MQFSFRTFTGRHQFVCDTIKGRALRFLDVGNLGDGASSNLRLKAEVEKAGGTYTGLDSNTALTLSLKLPNQVVGDLHAAPFEDNTFDAIYAGEIIEHTWTPAKMITECHRILKPGGLLILDTPNPYSITSILNFLLRKESNMGDNRTLTYEEAKGALQKLAEGGQTLLQPQHKIFFTPAMLKQMLETHGFLLESMGVTAKTGSFFARFLLWLFPHAGSHLCVVAKKATIDEAFADILSH